MPCVVHTFCEHPVWNTHTHARILRHFENRAKHMAEEAVQILALAFVWTPRNKPLLMSLREHFRNSKPPPDSERPKSLHSLPFWHISGM